MWGVGIGALAGPGAVVTSSGSLGRSHSCFPSSQGELRVSWVGGRTLKANRSPEGAPHHAKRVVGEPPGLKEGAGAVDSASPARTPVLPWRFHGDPCIKRAHQCGLVMLQRVRLYARNRSTLENQVFLPSCL